MTCQPMPTFDSRAIDRFWSHVQIAAPDQCWLWQIGRDSDGYGKFSFQQATYRTHRVAYYLHYGIDPADQLVCHSCDNPQCCNPYHLFLGDNQKNIVDARDKGRLNPRKGDQHGLRLHPESVNRGEAVPTSVLTDDDVREIRRLYAADRWTQQRLADHFGVKRGTISQIIRGNHWRHLLSPDEPASLSDPERRIKHGEESPNAKLTADNVREIRDLYSTGNIPILALARRYNVSHALIRSIVKRRVWKHIT
ncbi:MAG: HNH endonuclease [Bryobacterales bacterium]|nr:HNH endonuclease [Bryobacterales bacterium]